MILADEIHVSVGDCLEESGGDVLRTGAIEPYRSSVSHQDPTVVPTLGNWGNTFPIALGRIQYEDGSVSQHIPRHGTCDAKPTLRARSGSSTKALEAVVPHFASHLRLCKKTRHSSACCAKIARAIIETLQNSTPSDEPETGGFLSRSTSSTNNGTSQISTSSFQGSSRIQGSSRRRYGKRDGGEPPDRRRNGRQPTPALARAEKRFACPFFMRFPSQYRQCASFGSPRICDVRQHILRHHIQRSHCPRCGIAYDNDPNNARLNQHIVGCNATHPLHHSGITMDQFNAMRAESRLDSNSTPERRWWAIWSYLFPDYDTNGNRQVTAYIPAGYGAEIHIIREYQLSHEFRQRVNSLVSTAQRGGAEDLESEIGELMDEVAYLFRDYQ